jgi:hypothetical protein
MGDCVGSTSEMVEFGKEKNTKSLKDFSEPLRGYY